MAEYAVERNGELVRHIVFVGEGLYKDQEVRVATFPTEKSAKELADVLGGVVVDYHEYLRASEQPLAA